MVNMLQIIALVFFGLTAYEISGWMKGGIGLPETPYWLIYLFAFALLLGIAEIVRRLPSRTESPARS